MKRIIPYRVPVLSISFTILTLSALLLWFPYLPSASQAQAEAPITPSGLHTQVSDPTAVGGHIQYDITGGTRPGGGVNLFHSFGDFNVPTNNIANFLNDSGLATSNILARVTGTNGNNPTLSSIYGTIQTTNFGHANLFLMNPAGFLFGSNATVNVGGMMTFTTADYLKLTGIGQFNAIPNATADALLSASPVVAFGFLGSNPNAIITFEGGQLTVADGTGVTLVGGDITLMPDSSGTTSGITAPGRPILLTSVIGRGEVSVDTGIPSAGMVLGTITLGQGTTLSTVGDLAYGDGSGGAVSIRGGQFVAIGANILTSPAIGSMGHGGDVTITTTGSAGMTNSTIDSRSLSANGGGGAISVAASDLTLQDSAIVTRVIGNRRAATSAEGAAGAVSLTGTDSLTLTRSFVNSSTQFSNGNGGAVAVIAPTVTLEDSAIISSTTGNAIPQRMASGGPVTLGDTRTNSVSLTRSAIFTESSETEGNSGSVTITGQNVMIGGNEGQQTIVTSTHSTSGDPSSGNGGEIVITGTNVTFTDIAWLESVADSPGTLSRGGNIRINGAQDILVDNGTVFTTTTISEGSAGNIELVSPQVIIRGQSQLGSATFTGGGAGTISITGTQNIALESGSLIVTTAGPGSQGPAGHIEINTPQLIIMGGSAVRSENLGSGPGGTINIAANQVRLNSGATITTNSAETADAGNINITATNGLSMQNSSITTQAAAAGGGTIKITTDPSGTVQLTNSTISASVLDGTGGGGSVNIDPQFVILNNSQILAQAVQGPGGNISITTNLLLPDANSVISASSQFGVNGTVTIQSPNAPISGQIQPLGGTPLPATSLLNQRCASLAGGEFSSFTVAGRDSLPTEPGGWLVSPLAMLDAGTGLAAKGEREGLSGLSGSSGWLGLSGLVRAGSAARQIDQTNQINETNPTVLSLRQIAPAGFLTQVFAVDRSAGCQS